MIRNNDELIQDYDWDAIPVSEILREEGNENMEVEEDENEDDIPQCPPVEGRSAKCKRDFLAHMMWDKFKERPWYRRWLIILLGQ